MWETLFKLRCIHTLLSVIQAQFCPAKADCSATFVVVLFLRKYATLLTIWLMHFFDCITVCFPFNINKGCRVVVAPASAAEDELKKT
jgi:hypothetical protein